jgi:hypothetical protein
MKKLLLSVLMVFTFSALTFAKNEAAKSADAIDESRLSTSSEAAKLKATKQ